MFLISQAAAVELAWASLIPKVEGLFPPSRFGIALHQSLFFEKLGFEKGSSAQQVLSRNGKTAFEDSVGVQFLPGWNAKYFRTFCAAEMFLEVFLNHTCCSYAVATRLRKYGNSNVADGD